MFSYGRRPTDEACVHCLHVNAPPLCTDPYSHSDSCPWLTGVQEMQHYRAVQPFPSCWLIIWCRNFTVWPAPRWWQPPHALNVSPAECFTCFNGAIQKRSGWYQKPDFTLCGLCTWNREHKPGEDIFIYFFFLSKLASVLCTVDWQFQKSQPSRVHRTSTDVNYDEKYHVLHSCYHWVPHFLSFANWVGCWAEML